jgi:hypothetical protein
MPSDDVTLAGRTRRQGVVSLEQELKRVAPVGFAARLHSRPQGGPGSGKSSFARIFAARLAEEGKHKVLFVPLHRQIGKQSEDLARPPKFGFVFLNDKLAAADQNTKLDLVRIAQANGLFHFAYKCSRGFSRGLSLAGELV